MTETTVVVVDGSNIATEGRSLPSLAQLDEAVRAFLEEYPHDQFIVVVDATFEHRIDPSERQMYDEALAANELLTPPAGTIGRGDAFILAIAEKAGATVFSNDSFQEFHGDFEWLFDEGRLIGGKPVPYIGWVFTARTPVRGQKSRQATRAASRKRVRGGESASAKSAQRSSPRRSATSPAANQPMPVPKAPPPGPVRRRDTEPAGSDGSDESVERADGGGAGSGRSGRRSGRRRGGASPVEPVNEGLAFVTFISEHEVGTTVEGEVTEFSSHGAYVSVGDARCYVPLSALGEPAPRAARDVLEKGEVRTFVVQAVDGPRRAIDLALPGFEQLDAPVEGAPPQAEAGDARVAVTDLVAEVAAELADAPVVRRRTRKGPARRRVAGEAASAGTEAEASPGAPEAPITDEPAPTRRRRASSKAAAPEEAPAEAGVATPPRGRGRRVAVPDPGAPGAPSGAEPTAGDEVPAARRRRSPAAPSTEAAAASRPTEATEVPPARRSRRAATTDAAEAEVAAPAPARKRTAKRSATGEADTGPSTAGAAEAAPTKRTPAKRTAKKAAAPTAGAAPDEGTPASEPAAPVKRRAAAGTATAKKAAAKKAPAAREPAGEAPVTKRKAAAKKAPAKKASPTAKKATAKKAAAKKATGSAGGAPA